MLVDFLWFCFSFFCDCAFGFDFCDFGFCRVLACIYVFFLGFCVAFWCLSSHDEDIVEFWCGGEVHPFPFFANFEKKKIKLFNKEKKPLKEKSKKIFVLF